MKRISNWNAAKRKACVSEFRRLLGSIRKDQVENAMAAGRSLAKLALDGKVTILGIDDVQLERYRRRYAVPHNLKGIMYGVATGQLTDDLLEERLDQKFRSHILLSGRVRLRHGERCALCAKRTCRCETIGERPEKFNRNPKRIPESLCSF